MHLLPVLKFPDPFLKTRCILVTSFDPALAEQFRNMVETMYHNVGVGLAATQVGSNLRMFVMDCSFDHEHEDTKKPVCVVNPEIVSHEGEVTSEEGCLSVPDFRAEVKRFERLTLKYQDEFGQPHSRESTGLEAICVQHEMDHLQGILFIDHLSALRRKLVQKRLKKQANSA